jgi:hypothetical protein
MHSLSGISSIKLPRPAHHSARSRPLSLFTTSFRSVSSCSLVQTSAPLASLNHLFAYLLLGLRTSKTHQDLTFLRPSSQLDCLYHNTMFGHVDKLDASNGHVNHVEGDATFINFSTSEWCIAFLNLRRLTRSPFSLFSTHKAKSPFGSLTNSRSS